MKHTSHKRGFSKIAIAAAIAAFGIAAASARATNFTGTVLYPLMVPSDDTVIAVPGYPQPIESGQVVGDGYGSGGSSLSHALLWSGPGGSAVDLNPTLLAGFTFSIAKGVYGNQQVGEGTGSATGGNDHALLWSGTPDSAVDLNPAGFTASQAFYTIGTQQIGYGSGAGTGNNAHALIWSSTAASAVDLNPTSLAISSSVGNATDGAQQVGKGFTTVGNIQHAMLWSNTAASAVDLNPAGFSQSNAIGVGGNQQFGQGVGPGTGGNQQAILWKGTAASAINLNPTDLIGITTSFGNATNGIEQIGEGEGPGTGNIFHAILWSGTPDSAVDLQSLLPAIDTWTTSQAFTFDNLGNVYGIASGTVNGVTGTYAVEWSPVPEPTSLTLMAIAGFGLLGRRRRPKRPA
jgi:hypothetical protein